MKRTLWKKIDYFFGLIFIGALFGLVVLLSNIEIRDLDLWLHLGMGKFISHHGFVPSIDMLSCSIAGHPWINHEWLFQVLIHKIFTNSGFDGLMTMQLLLVSITLLVLLFIGYDKDKLFTTIFTLMLVLMVYQIRFTLRPDLFSLLFFALFIFIMSLFIDRKWSLYVLFALQILWTNMHGFFFFGPLFILIGVSTEWMKRRVKLPYEWNSVGRLEDDEYKRMKQVLILVILACLVNPLTFKGAWYPIKVFFQLSGESKIFFQHIQELQKPILLRNIFDFAELPYYKILILISIMSFVYNRRRIDIGGLFFWLAFLCFSLIAVRNIPFFAFAAYLIIITNFYSLSFNDIVPVRFVQKKFFYVTAIAIKILLLVWMADYSLSISDRGYFDFDKFQRKSEIGGVSLRSYPTKAVDFLVKNDVKGNAFNDFNSGAYLVGRAFPNIKVFIDGRTEVYGPKFFKDYKRIYNDGNSELFEIVEKKCGITIAFLNSSKQRIPKKILKYFYNNKSWIPVYFDYDGIIFLKDVPDNKSLIKEFKIDLAKWPGTKMNLLRLGAKRVDPYQFLNRAFSLEAMEIYDGALAEAQEALKVDPRYTDSYQIMGKVYSERKDYEKAFEYFRIASVLNSSNRTMRYNLAKTYEQLEEYGNAIYQYQKLINHNPGDSEAYFLITRSFIKNEQYGEALQALRQAHRIEPKNFNDLFDLSNLFIEDKQYEQGIHALLMALETGKREDEVRNKLGLAYKTVGEKQKAKEEFEKAIKLKPDKREYKRNLRKLGFKVPRS